MPVSPLILHVSLGLLSALVLIGAVWVVTLRNLFRAALCLGLVLVGVAGLFLLLEAEFLAFVQILVYVGAILTLVVFAIMLTARAHQTPDVGPSRQRGAAGLACLALFILLSRLVVAMPLPQPTINAVSLESLGRELITTLILPFELISLVFVAAMIGAVVIAWSPGLHKASKP